MSFTPGTRNSGCRDTSSFCFEGIEGEALLFPVEPPGDLRQHRVGLRFQGPEGLPVLCAIGLSPEVAQGSLVLTMDRDTRRAEMDYVLAELPPAVERLRSFSPVWRKKIVAEAGGAS